MIPGLIAIAGLGAAGAGFLKSRKAGKEASAAQAEVTAASVKAEGLRRQQMILENRRRQRDIIRQGMIQRSLGISGAVGAGAENSSSFFGGMGSLTSQVGQGVLAQAQNTQIGEGLFSANVSRMNAELRLGNARSKQQEGQGLMSLGSSLITNASSLGSGLSSAGSSIGGLFSANSGGDNPYRASNWNHTSTMYGT